MSSGNPPTEDDIRLAGLRVELLQDSSLVLIGLYGPELDRRVWARDYLARAGWDEQDLIDAIEALEDARHGD